MKPETSLRLRQAIHRFFLREQEKSTLLRLKEQAAAPAWVAEGALRQGFRLLQIGEGEPSSKLALPLRDIKKSPGATGFHRKGAATDRMANAAIRFLDAEAPERGRIAGRLILPLAILSLGGRFAGAGWIGNLLGKILKGGKV